MTLSKLIDYKSRDEYLLVLGNVNNSIFLALNLPRKAGVLLASRRFGAVPMGHFCCKTFRTTLT